MFRVNFKRNGLALLASLFIGGAVMPSLASADIVLGPPRWQRQCNGIRYQGDVLKQVKVMFSGKKVEEDAAVCILQRIQNADEKVEVGIFLGKNLRYPEELDDMLDEGVLDLSVQARIREGVSGRGNEPYRVLDNVCVQLKKDGDSLFVQFRDYVKGDLKIRASDVACIIQGEESGEQQKIVDYAVGHLADPENFGAISGVLRNAEHRAAFEKAIRSQYPNLHSDKIRGSGK